MLRRISSWALPAGALCFLFSAALAQEGPTLPLKLQKGKSYTFDVSRTMVPQAAQATAGTLQYKLTVEGMKERGHGVLGVDIDRAQFYRYVGANPPQNAPQGPIHLQVFIGQGGAASEIRGLDESFRSNADFTQPLIAHLDAILGNGLHYQRLEQGKAYVLRPLFATGKFSSAEEAREGAREGIQTKYFRWFLKFDEKTTQKDRQMVHFTVLAPQQVGEGQDKAPEEAARLAQSGQKQGEAFYAMEDGVLWSFTYSPQESGVRGFTIVRK